MGRLLNLEDVRTVTGQEKYWAYCALDVTGTREVFDALYPRLDEHTNRTYSFERGLQAPAFTMMRRGVLVNERARKSAVKELEKELTRLEKAVNADPKVKEVWDGYELETGKCKANKGGAGRHKWPRGEPDDTRRCDHCGTARRKTKPFNPNSSTQSLHLFQDLHSVAQTALRKKDKSYGVNEDVLNRIAHKHKDLKELCALMLDVRGVKKQLGFLEYRRAADGRYYSSFNVGAAWTGRWSSSKNPFNQGGNMQNVAERHRHIFIADPGYTMFYADLKQAESMLVAYLAGDDGYIDAHMAGDTHTYVARLVWPELLWTGELEIDKRLAKKHNPSWDTAPGHDYRFQAKRMQHGSNYGLSPQGIAMIAKIPKAAAAEAHENYLSAFPGIEVWQRNTREEVTSSRPLVNPLGRRIRLFGRPWDGHTYKQGLSFRPQSGVADILNLALWRLWREHDPELVQVLAQVHDAILGQFPTDGRGDALRVIMEAMTIPVQVLGADGKWREMVIPVEIATGSNWGKQSKDNPNGLAEVEL